jgi:hypothetical protein
VNVKQGEISLEYKIRHLSVSSASPFIAAGEFESTIYIYDIEKML